jgi:GNAT superfamily N-acetyltransferase
MRKDLPEIHFRPFAEGDVELLEAWLEGAGLGAPPWVSSETWGHRLMHDPRIICRAAYLPDGAVVAFLRLDVAPDRTAEVTVVVAPGWRDKGIGVLVIDDALAEARGMRLRRLVAVIKAPNRPAQALFKISGFEPSGTEMPGYHHLERLIHSADHQPPLEIKP